MGPYPIVKRPLSSSVPASTTGQTKMGACQSIQNKFLPRFPVMASWASVVDQSPVWTIRVSSYPWDYLDNYNFKKGEYLQRLSLAQAANGARATVWRKAGGEVPWRWCIIGIDTEGSQQNTWWVALNLPWIPRGQALFLLWQPGAKAK